MRIRFVAKDPDSVPDQSPTLYKTDQDSWLVQGWVVTDPQHARGDEHPCGGNGGGNP